MIVQINKKDCREGHLQRLPSLVGAAGASKHAAGVWVLFAALAPPGPPAAAAAAEAVKELLQVVAVKVGAAEDQALLHPARGSRQSDLSLMCTVR